MNEQKAEVHKFSFMSSRFATFQEQAGSFIINNASGAEQYAMYTKGFAFSDNYINDTLKQLVRSSTSDDLSSVRRYAVPYERLVFGGFGLNSLEPADTSVITLLINNSPADPGNQRLLGILIRNPEPFNDPKLPAELLTDTIKLSITLPDNTIVSAETFISLYSRDNSAVLITNAQMNIPLGTIQLRFLHKIFNGNDYHTIEEYNSPALDLSSYFFTESNRK